MLACRMINNANVGNSMSRFPTATGLLVGLFFPEVKQARGVSDRRALWLQSGSRLMSKFLAGRSRNEATAG